MQSEGMIKSDSAILVKKCCEILRHEIISQDDEYVADLASYIVGVTTHRLLSELIHGMIQGDVLPSHLSRALMRCQLLILEQEIPVLSKHSPEKQIQHLKTMIEHFNYISLSIVQVGEEVWSDHVDTLQHDLQVEKQQHLLDVVMRIWKYENKIKLLNYYKGLPVQVMANIESIEMLDDRPIISVRKSTALERVLAVQKNQFVLTPDSEDAVLIHLQLRYEQVDKVVFIVNTLSNMKKRKHFRLEPVETVAIRLYRNKKVAGSGKVLDFSLKHLDISMPIGHGLTFEVNEIVDVCFQLQNKEMKGGAWVRHICPRDQEVILCLELMPQAHLQRNLQQEVAVLQRRIIQEIKEKFTVLHN